MEIKGKLIQILPLQSGEGKNGVWKKQDIILEQQGQIPKKVCISVWGDKINMSLLKAGAILTVQADVESREFNGKWYTDVKAWKVESASVSAQEEPELPDFSPETPDDLPF